MPQQLSARDSPYYPPRAGGWRAPRRLLGSIRARIYLDRIHLPPLRNVLTVAAAVLLPGLAFHLKGPRVVAKVIWIAVPVLLLIFLAGLGTFVAEVAFGLLISAHVASVSHLLSPMMRRTKLALQMVFGVVLFAAASILLYIPGREWFHSHVAMPLNVHGQVVVMNPRATPKDVHRGDLVAYRIHASTRWNVVVRDGMGSEPVLGMPGDRVVFGDGFLTVNGVPHPLAASASSWGQFDVPEECWFIWPKLIMVNRGIAGGAVNDRLRGLAVVPQGNFVGRPYGWWFFRAQGST